MSKQKKMSRNKELFEILLRLAQVLTEQGKLRRKDEDEINLIIGCSIKGEQPFIFGYGRVDVVQGLIAAFFVKEWKSGAQAEFLDLVSQCVSEGLAQSDLKTEHKVH